MTTRFTICARTAYPVIFLLFNVGYDGLVNRHQVENVVETLLKVVTGRITCSH